MQGSPVDIGGYYRPDPEQVAAAMRPSETFNDALARRPGLVGARGLARRLSSVDAVDVGELRLQVG